MKSTKYIATFAAAAALAVAGVTATAFAKDDGGRIKSDMMIGVPAALTGEKAPIRGIKGGGLPWTIGEAEVSVKSSGKVEAEFQNLILPDRGFNPIGSMAVVVSCLDASNNVVNVASAPFAVTVGTSPADPGGDADVETKVDLPSSCLAPIVFIVGAANGAWFAVDGL